MNRSVSQFSSSSPNAEWTTDNHQPRRSTATATTSDARGEPPTETTLAEPFSHIRLGATSRLFLQKQLGITAFGTSSSSYSSSSSNSHNPQLLCRPHAGGGAQNKSMMSPSSYSSSTSGLHPLLRSKRRLGKVAPHLFSTSELAYANDDNRAATSMSRLLELIREGMDGQEDHHDDEEEEERQRTCEDKKKKKKMHALSCNELLMYSTKRRRLNQHNNNNRYSSSSSMIMVPSSPSVYMMAIPTSSSSLSLQKQYRSVFAQVLNRETS